MKTKDRSDVGAAQTAQINLPSGVTEAEVNAHVMAPEHVQGVSIEEHRPADLLEANLRASAPLADAKVYHANIDAFGLAMDGALESSVVGYMWQARKNGTLVHTGQWNWSQTPADGGLGWSQDRRMHIASVSKFFTAVAMVKALDSKGIDYDTPIRSYLPSYWVQGQNINKITFAHLMTHRSGFSGESSRTDYPFMKARVAAGVMSVPGGDYENMNFGLCRILIPIVTGMISKNHNFGPDYLIDRDKSWDATTINLYQQYMHKHVFNPAGVPKVGFAPANGGALAYRQPHDNLDGWNTGDLRTLSGGGGFRMTCKEVLDVMSHVRRKGTIVSKPKAQVILDRSFGIDVIAETPAGKIYYKNGIWGKSNAVRAFETEQAVAFFLPEGIEVAVFVNSPVGPGKGSFLADLVRQAYVDCLE